jgi:hypothetical protein
MVLAFPNLKHRSSGAVELVGSRLSTDPQGMVLFTFHAASGLAFARALK